MSSNPPQTEKPYHYTYLKEFRVNQCPLFLQHKCTQHRPFTCFNWHFANQRRRRPMRKRDGTFSYSSDVYCSKFDETTGICPNGDECTYLHRNTGDTERRYHLRYYKTGTCIHETDSRGNCVKNGPHCAFAHGAQDLRPPVYDIREMEMKSDVSQKLEPLEQFHLSEKIINDDPKWQDANYVLANYKTEPCRRPPRLCRQGYACPQYHNPKDRRRNPKKYKYRSSPCPNVKQGDDWKDPSCCEKGDNCQFCHTRTEQQFHPEIYKSTKCHDVMQSGYCPRGPFCAFAHVQQEIRIIDESEISTISPQARIILPGLGSQELGAHLMGLSNKLSSSAPGAGRPNVGNLDLHFNILERERVKPNVWNSDSPTLPSVGSPFGFQPGLERQQPSSLFQMHSNDGMGLLDQNPISSNNMFPSCPSPIAKPNWSTSHIGKSDIYAKAPGSGRNEFQGHSVGSGFSGLAGSPFSWGSLPNNSHLNMNSMSSNGSSPMSLNRLKSLNCEAKPFYPPDETVDSVIGNALDEFDLQSNLSPLNRPRTSSASRLWPEPIGTRRDSKDNSSFFTMSAPVNIPQDGGGMGMSMRLPQRYPLPTPSPPGSNSHPLLYGSLDAGANRSSFGSIPSMGRPPSSSSFSGKEGSGSNDMQMELERMQRKCRQWVECWNQAKTACDAWKKEATEANARAKSAEEIAKKISEKSSAFEEELVKASSEIAILAEEVQNRGDKMNEGNEKCMFLHRAQKLNLLKQITVKDLKELRNKLKTDLDSVDKVLWENYGVHCEEGWVKK